MDDDGAMLRGRADASPTRALADKLLSGLGCYYVTSLVAIAGLIVSGLLERQHSPAGPEALAASFGRWDGGCYEAIAGRGYRYAPSTLAFSPAFPLAGRWAAAVTGWSPATSLIVVAHMALSAAFVLFYAYLRPVENGRCITNNRPARARRDLALIAMGLWPTTVFFRMAYSESLMLLVAIGAMYAMRRGARPWLVALLVGLGTACRPVGVALLGPLALYLWERATRGGILRCAQNDGGGRNDGGAQIDAPESTTLTPALSQGEREKSAAGGRGASTRGAGTREALWRFAGSAAIWMPLACWGIIAFMIFQWIEFGDPLAWAKAQQNWVRRSQSTYLEQWGYALILEPIWSVYVPSSPAYWARHLDAPANPVFNLPFANPIYFVVSVYLVWLGWKKRWLDGKEVLLAALLLGIPYFTHSYRHMMLSQGRFAALAFPVYIVLGRLLARMPAPLAAVCCALSAALMAAYAALFAAWYRVT